ncbi:MAG: NADH-quinone oxidoreductase subunit L [Chloroflexi bacterium]|nr:NADH-quinone oxidoreductase subunit L [Chloroflexota bacterium]
MSESIFNLAWLIPLPTLLAFFIIFFTRENKRLSSTVALIGVFVGWLLSWVVAISAFRTPERSLVEPFDLSIPYLPTGASFFTMGVLVDGLTAIMLFMVGIVLAMIFIYSTGYMTFPGFMEELLGKGSLPPFVQAQVEEAKAQNLDPKYSRFFAFISLFATGMLGLVVADNLLMLFIFWEIMGLCSYLLIGFWYNKTYPDPKQITPPKAGLKAFITTRVGDVLLLIGLVYLWLYTGQLNFRELFQPEVLEHLAESVMTLPVIGAVSAAVVISILIFWGSIGKSAQFPLHVWLPDAMEGPTPVSALIHAATMVSAGVYLIARMWPVFNAYEHGANGAAMFVTFIGAFTALFAATIAVAQNDIKRVLAYSTISQLGYMFAALGIGAWVAAIFHLIMHAFFKALLFLGSGSVIHGVEHGHHHAHAHNHDGDDHHKEEEYFDPQDMMNMGGLLRRMPATGWTFIIGGAALSGFPLITAGFWSKDLILAEAWYTGHTLVFWTLAAAALLTAFYTFRQIFLTFFGQPRSEAAAHAPESVKSMTAPLMVLAVFAIAAGWSGIETTWPIVGNVVGNPLGHFMGELAETYGLHYKELPFNPMPVGISVIAALGGIFLAWLVYGRKPLQAGDVDPLRRWLGPVHTVLRNKYYFDELYYFIAVRPVLWLARFAARFDRGVIDAIVNAVGSFGRWLARSLRRFVDEYIIDAAVNGTGLVAHATGSVLRLVQNGQIQQYLLIMLLAVLVLMAAVEFIF